MNGKYAISTAGHDAGKIYIIVGTQDEDLYLADGVVRTLQKPKKKNAKHVEIPLQETDLELAEIIISRRTGCDEAIRQKLHHLRKDNFRYKLRK